jgi:hypothetical protein
MKYLKQFENFGVPSKWEVNGVEASLVDNEIYFPASEEVILFEDPKMAGAAFSWAKLHAEDGKSVEQIIALIRDRIRNN